MLAQNPLRFLTQACCVTLSKSFHPRPWCLHLHNGEVKNSPVIALPSFSAALAGPPQIGEVDIP